MTQPDVSVVVLAFGAEEYLHEAVRAVLASEGVTIELVVVDNGCTSDAVGRLPADERVEVLTPGRNLGFTGGVNLGARRAHGRFLALVNSDAVVEPSTLSRLVTHLEGAPDVGVAGATVLLADSPGTVNSAGNPLHVLGLSWAGRMGTPAAEVPAVRDVASASGACLVLRRDLWEHLRGFPDEYFAYMEDMELSWRCWQQGLRVQVLGDARVLHHYEFSRSPLKMYLVERNRWLLLLTCHERATLAALALPLVAFDLALLLVAVLQGWGRQKVAGWWWCLTHASWIRRRRAVVQRARTVPDRELFSLLTDTFDPAQTPLPPAARPLEGVLRAYWSTARRLLTRKGRP
ncbi:glycosyltransferase family 2 protein [Cellulosimicrobium sp. Marseille-Q4280]|uniref:glycosyltransferase family 2 protein n=1 Tax=Cellulosimicrobium sp. Marseille-Q4280 TaxID=2937992 RepID=UPI00203AAD4C|nr:glycosyltransferase family 2 protein [Cellulosimicrobium sp. Marseille-Q4280]